MTGPFVRKAMRFQAATRSARRTDRHRMIEWAMPLAEAGRGLDGLADIEVRAGDGVVQRHFLGEPGGDGRSERAAGAVRAAAGDAGVLEAIDPSVVEQKIDKPVPLEMTTLHQHGLGAE